uniref:Protein ENHANCED DISEASE RESISTANCE 2 C-terminal domain-containing protein n=1 Tax=Nelumbo nucifera TaxID=4432 RepID=A0A822YWG4_NELNU|nr:TPA_asm: hypothetical protein HUJ06_012419 [Nelumbo nucifera]
MCSTKQKNRSSGGQSVGVCSKSSINGGSLKRVDLQTGSNGWASPSGDLFALRSKNFFTKRQKCLSGDWLLKPVGVDWLRSLANALRKSYTTEPIPVGSLFYRFIHGDYAFRNQRFKIVNRLVKGSWIVKAAMGSYAACLLENELIH